MQSLITWASSCRHFLFSKAIFQTLVHKGLINAMGTKCMIHKRIHKKMVAENNRDKGRTASVAKKP